MKSWKLSLLAGSLAAIMSSASPADVIRDYYEETGLNPVRETINQNFHEHIDPFSGILQLSFTDISIPGNGGFDLNIQRIYTSPQERLLPYSPYGYGWTMHFGRIIVAEEHDDKICAQDLWSVSVRDNPSLEFQDGSRQLLVLADYHSPELITRNWWSANCVGGDVIVRSPDGTSYYMTEQDTNGGETSIYATYIEDANGNSMTITYNTNPIGYIYIDEITTSDGRLVDFEYADISTGSIRLATITANNQTWRYEYAFTTNTAPAYPQLVEVIRPDNLHWQFDYYPQLLQAGVAGSYAMQRITYPWGGYIEYTYDEVAFQPGGFNSTVVLASKQTGGRDITPGTWTFDYTPGYLSSTGYDETLVTGPDGLHRYYHFGYANAGPGSVWRVGLKEIEEISDPFGNITEQIIYTYAPFVVSDENYWHGRDTSKIDNNTALPFLMERRHYRESRVATTTYGQPDSFANPTVATETTTLFEWPDRVTNYLYDNDASAWILGLVKEEERVHAIGSGPTTWKIARNFDAAGNLLSEDRFGVQTTYTYTTDGDVKTVTDNLGRTITYSNYYRGIPRLENHPEGISISRTVNNDGTVSSFTNGRGNTTAFTWDALNRLESVNYPIHLGASLGYSNDGRTSTRGAYREAVSLDGFGRDLTITRSDLVTGNVVQIVKERDSMGRISFQSYPGVMIGTSYSYDELGRRISAVQSDGSTRTVDYGQRIVITNENGDSTEYIYGQIGTMDNEWLMDILSPESIATLLTRGGRGNIMQAFQGKLGPDGTAQGQSRSYSYDSRGFLITEDHPENGITTYSYDAIGNMITREIGSSGIIETFTYDDRNRVTAIDYSDGTPDVSFTYDDNDNLVQVSSSTATRSFSYDANDNLITETLSVDGRIYTVSYTRDGLDHIQSVTYPSGRTVTFSPNALGRETQASPYANQVQHHPNGLVSTMMLANGVTTTLSLDSRQRVSSILTSGPGGTLVDLAYSYDNGLNPLQIIDSLGSIHDRTLAYDGVDRLTSATGPWGTETVSYDALGNINVRDRNGNLQEYLYSGNKLAYRNFVNMGAYIVSHDARGNLTDDGPKSYAYDGAGNLVTAIAGSAVVDYAYDGEGKRVQRSSAGTTTDVFYNREGQLLGEYDPSGGFREYVYVGTGLITRISDDTTVVGTSN